MERKYTSEIDGTEDEVKVEGWLREKRDLGKIKFLVLADRKGEIQVTVKGDESSKEILEKVDGIPRESVISVEGQVQESEQAPGGREVLPKRLEILNESKKPLPLDPRGKQEANLATRLDNRFMDLRKQEKRAIFEVRSAACQGAREWFDENDFLEIHTPKITVSGTEGGAEVFPIIYYEREAFLVQSAQLYKQLMQAGGAERVYEITPQWRAEKSRTPRHVTESWSVDMEMSFIQDEEDVMEVQEKVMRAMAEKVKEGASKQLEKLDAEVKVPELPLKRLTYDEALEIASEEGEEIEWGEDINIKAMRRIAERLEEQGDDFYFIKRWPSSEKAFYYRPEPSDKKYSRTFDLNYRSWELSSGGQRIHDLELLKERIENQGMDPSNMEFYLDAFRYGMPPHGGFGLGLDRFVSGILGLKNIQESILFPRTPDRLEP
ncbi:MAG: aspartate--tRNA(Asn) ligase [Candidatus Aenigmatarchaeota archaeon]